MVKILTGVNLHTKVKYLSHRILVIPGLSFWDAWWTLLPIEIFPNRPDNGFRRGALICRAEEEAGALAGSDGRSLWKDPATQISYQIHLIPSSIGCNCLGLLLDMAIVYFLPSPGSFPRSLYKYCPSWLNNFYISGNWHYTKTVTTY